MSAKNNSSTHPARPNLLCLPADSVESLTRLGVSSFIWKHYAPSGTFNRVTFCFLGNREESHPIDTSSSIRIFRKRWGNALPFKAFFYLIRIPYFVLRMVLLIRRENIHVVRARSAGYNALAGVLAARITGRPSAISIHAPYLLDLQYASNRSTLSKWEEILYERLCLRLANHVYGVSTAMRKYAIRLGTPEHHAKVLFNRVDIGKFQRRDLNKENNIRDRLQIGPEDKLLIAVGRFVPQKDPLGLLETLRILLKKDPTYRLILIGIGWMQPQMETFIATHGLASRVHFEGNVQNNDLPSYFHLSHAFVLPALYEGFGIVLVEAQAAGIPIVTTKITGTADVVSQENALLVPPKNPPALANAITHLFLNPEETNTRVDRGLQDVQRFEQHRIESLEIFHYRCLLSTTPWKIPLPLPSSS